MDDSTRLDIARQQIISARAYTESLLADLDPGCWFTQPAGASTHVAWQVGHLAMAQYRLALDRVRGVQPGDEDLISEQVLSIYGKDSVPDPDPAANATPAEIRAAFDAVHARVIEEIGGMDDSILPEPATQPHPVFGTKGGALEWSAQHEMLHAGQIGLLRRRFGEDWLR